jgi:hypothetical protein
VPPERVPERVPERLRGGTLARTHEARSGAGRARVTKCRTVRMRGYSASRTILTTEHLDAVGSHLDAFGLSLVGRIGRDVRD